MKAKKLRKSSDKKPTSKQVSFAGNLATGMAKKDAALKAGYSASTAENTKEIEKAIGFQQAQKSILSAMQRQGINDEKVVQRLYAMLMATHKVLSNGKVIEIDNVHPTAVAKALDIIFKLRGDYTIKITSIKNPLEKISVSTLLKNLRQLEV